MKLQSAQNLKQELLSVPSSIVASVADTRSFSAFAESRSTAESAMSEIALGVAPTSTKNEYKLAVRLQRLGPLVSAMTEQIKQRAKGEVDIQHIGNIVKLASPNPTQPAFYQRKLRPLRIGSSIGDVPTGFIAAGTFGAFVVRRSSPFYLGILTNNHVIAGENSNPLNSPVVQAGTLDGGRNPRDRIGALGKVVKIKPTAINFVDAAVADLFEGIEFDPRTIGNLGDLSGQANVANLPPRATVYKVGRTTGQTKGRITAFDVDNVSVQYDIGDVRFDNQIEIEGTGNRSFSDAGDSGSLIVDAQLRAIGLLFAGGDVGGSNNQGLTYANPIKAVLDALKVDLEL